MSTPLPVSEIPTLTLLYKLNKISPSASTVQNATSRYNSVICLLRHDITKLAVDSIVNAANESLLGGGGVDGAIHSAAGADLLRECRTLDGCNTGSAKITDAYRLPCKKVIHAVGPVYWSAERKWEGLAAELLTGCYRRSLELAAEAGCRSVAFSCLSTGVFGYPSEEAAEVAIRAVKGWLDEDETRAGRVERVVFCCFLQKDVHAYTNLLPRFFPPAGIKQQARDEQQATTNEDGKAAEKGQVVGEAEKEGAGELPELPDAPTKEPTEMGQPERKRARTSSDGVRPSAEVEAALTADEVARDVKEVEAKNGDGDQMARFA